MIARKQGSIMYFITFLDFGTIHGHLRGTINSYRQCTHTGIASVNNEILSLTGLNSFQTRTGSMDSSGIGYIFANLNAEGWARNMNTIKFDVNGMNAIFAWIETHWSHFTVNGLDEAIIIGSRGSDNLSIQFTLGTVFAHHKLVGSISLYVTFGELLHLQFVSITGIGRYIYFEWWIGYMAVIEFQTNTVFTGFSNLVGYIAWTILAILEFNFSLAGAFNGNGQRATTSFTGPDIEFAGQTYNTALQTTTAGLN